MAQPLNIILFGKAGSGKGTQANFLVAEYGLHRIETGGLLRKFSLQDIPAAQRLRDTLAKGRLAPSWLAFSLWLRDLEKLPDEQGVLFDGSPRKLFEAELLDEVLDWYERKSFVVLLIDISDTEAIRRLLLRARHDDTESSMRERLKWFRTDVMPVIEHYRNKGVLVQINGEQPIESVHRDILSRLPSPPRHHS